MLEDLYSRGIIYDWENYRNCHVVTLYSLRTQKYKTIKWFGDICEIQELIDILTKKDDRRILISFNGWAYDDAITNHILNNFNDPGLTKLELWEFGQTLIKGERNPYRYNSRFKSYDVLEVIRAGFNTIPLKLAAVNLKHPKIQDLPIPFEQEITEEQLPELISYNINDIDITKLILDYIKPRLEMRELLSESYKLDLYSLSDSGIGKELFNKLYIDRVKQKDSKINSKTIKYSRTNRTTIAFKDVILPEISFETPELQEYLEQLKTIVLSQDELEQVNINE